MGSVTTSTREGRSHIPTNSTRRPSSIQLEKRARQKEHGMALQCPRSVDPTDIFGTHSLQGPNFVGSNVATPGDDLGEGSRLSNWTPSLFESPILASVSDVANKQDGDHSFPFEGTGEPSVREAYQPLCPDIELEQNGSSSREPNGRPGSSVASHPGREYKKATNQTEAQLGRELDPRHPRSVNWNEIFGPHWRQNRYLVAANVSTLGDEDKDKRSSRSCK